MHEKTRLGRRRAACTHQATCDVPSERCAWFHWLVLGGSEGADRFHSTSKCEGIVSVAAPEPPPAFVLRQPNVLNWNNGLCSAQNAAPSTLERNPRI